MKPINPSSAPQDAFRGPMAAGEKMCFCSVESQHDWPWLMQGPSWKWTAMTVLFNIIQLEMLEILTHTLKYIIMLWTWNFIYLNDLEYRCQTDSLKQVSLKCVSCDIYSFFDDSKRTPKYPGAYPRPPQTPKLKGIPSYTVGSGSGACSSGMLENSYNIIRSTVALHATCFRRWLKFTKDGIPGIP